MASESIRFDFLTTGGAEMARQFKNTGDNAAAAARGAKVLQDTIKTLGDKENRTAAESANLAKALRLTGDAEDRAAAKALGAEIAIKRLGEAEQDAGRKADGARGGFAGLVGEITGFSSATTAASGKGGTFARALAGINLATGVAEPLLAGVVVAAGGLAAAYASAGIGLGVFGAVAQSVFTQASQAAQKYAQAQSKYDTATTSKQRAAALQAEKQAFAGLAPSVKTLAIEIGNVKQEWQGFTNAAAPGVVAVISKAFGLLPQAFALMRPFLAPVEQALSGIITDIKAGTGPTSQFAGIMRDFAKASGPDLSLALRTAGNLFLGLLGVIHSFLPEGASLLQWVEQASARFREWGTTLSGHTGFQSLMATFRTETPQAVAILKNLGTVLLNVGKAMTGLAGVGNSKSLLQALLPLSGVLASLSRNTALDRIALYMYAAASAAGKLKPAVAGVGAALSWSKDAWKGIVAFSGAVEGATAKEVLAAAATKIWAGAQAALNAVMDLNPFVLIATAVIALGAAFYVAWKKSATFRDIIKSIGAALLEAGILVVKGDKIIVDSFLSMVGTILHGAADAFGWVPGLGGKLREASKAFDGFKAGVDNGFNSMIKTMQGWQGELGASKRATDSASKAIVSDMTKAGYSTSSARQAVAAYTTAIQKNGAQSNQARGARQALIRDLEASGVSAQTAKRLVDNLETSINRMRGKTVNVGVHGSGSGGAKITVSSVGGGAFAGKLVAISNRAAGGIITGGHAGRDSVPAMLMPGEVVVPTGMVRAGAVDHLRGRLPGFASGGLVSPAPDVFAGRTENSYGADGKSAFGAVVSTAFKAAVTSAVNAVKAELAGSGQAVLNYAMGFLHKVPYVWGGSTPAGWDCSGMVSYVYDHFKLFNGRTTAAGFQQWAKPSGPVPGGLAFYGFPAHHVGFVTSDHKLLSALGTKWGTTISSLNMGDNSGYGVPPQGFGPAGGGGGPGPTGSKLKELAFTMLSQYGWSKQWPDFNLLETREAGWRLTATNPSSKAYGLAQFDVPPGGNLAANKAQYFAYGGNPNTAQGQLTAMLNYISHRYPSGPNQAWAHEVSAGWYDRGGFLKPGLTLAYNGTGRPEMVVPAGGRGGAAVHLEVRGSGSGTFDAFLVKWIQEHVRVRGGGNVQAAFGRR